MKRMYLLLLGLTLLLGACDKEGASDALPGGKGGSMARFAVSGNQLYTVNDQSLRFFDLTDPTSPTFTNELPLGFGIETIYPYKNTLFIGSQTGMHIYDITEPTQPRPISVYSHLFSCDPVVADDEYAYVTLRSDTPCRQAVNLLEVIDIRDLTQPRLVNAYQMVNPKGLGIDNQQLFVCDDKLKLFEVRAGGNLVERQKFDVEGYDVIPHQGLLVVTATDGLYQYRYSNGQINLLSKIRLQRQP